MKPQLLIIQGGGEGAHEWGMPLITALKEQLGNNYDVHFPKMPNEKNPQYHAWVHKIEEELQNLSGPVILLGHSLGGSVLLKYLSEQAVLQHIQALFLVSAPFWGVPDWEVDQFTLADNFTYKLPNVISSFIYHSCDDPFVPFLHHKRYKDLLATATVRTFNNAGHEMVKAVPTLIKDISSLKD